MNENRVNTIPANLAENGANMAQATNRAFADVADILGDLHQAKPPR